jgi:hypothetical protein
MGWSQVVKTGTDGWKSGNCEVEKFGKAETVRLAAASPSFTTSQLPNFSIQEIALKVTGRLLTDTKR